MDKRRLPLGVFYAAVLPVLVLSILAAIGIGSTPVAWETILRVTGVKLLPAGWIDPSR